MSANLTGDIRPPLRAAHRWPFGVAQTTLPPLVVAGELVYHACGTVRLTVCERASSFKAHLRLPRLKRSVAVVSSPVRLLARPLARSPVRQFVERRTSDETPSVALGAPNWSARNWRLKSDNSRLQLWPPLIVSRLSIWPASCSSSQIIIISMRQPAPTLTTTTTTMMRPR